MSAEAWLRLTGPDAHASIRDLLPLPGLTFTAWLNGRKMRDLDGLFQQFWDEFKLPDYFGWNLPAFDDCLSDLTWLPADHYVIVIEEAQEILCEEPETLPDILNILARTGQRWAYAERPDGSAVARFQVILACSESGMARMRSAITGMR
ncbi:barstar family protein [Streptomyces zagrosensis]|uniref:RNAse (Barnase) inhibitor barstar n=1 Tax=Streptomyces zagrosensis TaxID=1042984 RepID=A0A7W9Q6L1_9ACTN|nr:barstar family protein [Streptomyces zagrosensis]MBB5934541.1 RNAse (barnase) inhibitor barstar [Streptomyces zagrosensis]